MHFLRIIFLMPLFFIFSKVEAAEGAQREALHHVALSYVAFMNAYGQATDHATYYDEVDHLFSSFYTAIREGKIITRDRKHLKNRMGRLKKKGKWTLSAVEYSFDPCDSTVCNLKLLWSTEHRGNHIFTIKLKSMDGITIHSITENSELPRWNE
jgi:hypothetical protein